MHSFHQASHFVINGLTQTEFHMDSDEGFKLLQNEMIPGALHNSGERYDPPKCHPETRKAVLSNIMSWFNNENSRTRVMWLYGPAGAGKSAIAQTTAEECYSNGKLAASFFFSRFAAGRNKKDGLVATTAYQLCISIPAIKQYIVDSVERNPNIFRSNIWTQMQALVMEPFRLAQKHNVILNGPRVIIIDGLDECEIRNDQAEIIDAVIRSLAADRTSGLRVLFASRPEVEIRQSFNADHVYPLCTRLALDDTFNPDKDIECYLRSHFDTLKRKHILGSTIHTSWPSVKTVEKIVKKSSGQFIYASTVVQYISDPRHDPCKRLDVVLNIKPVNGDKPFAQLDALYSIILSACEDYQKVSLIFESIMFLERSPSNASASNVLASFEDLDYFLSLENECSLLLVDLHSIIDVNQIERKGIRFCHASLDDFLQDSSRSQQFHIDRYMAHARLSMHCITHIANTKSEELSLSRSRSRISSKGFREYIHLYCVAHCFDHFKSSNWNDIILECICENSLIKEQGALQDTINRIGFIDHSALGVFIRKVGKRRYAKSTIRDVIDYEILLHLEQYPQDVIFILYYFREYSDTPEPDEFVARLGQSIESSVNEVRNNEIMNDICCLGPTSDWFLNLVKETQHIFRLPKEDQAKAVCRLIDIAIRNTTWDYALKIFESILRHIPVSRRISASLRTKWESVQQYKWSNYELKEVIGIYLLNYQEKCDGHNDNISRNWVLLDEPLDVDG